MDELNKIEINSLGKRRGNFFMEDLTKLQKVIGVRFKKAGKVHLFDPGDEIFERGDYVLVDTTRGLEYGEVAIGVREIPTDENPETPEPRKIKRKATPSDIARIEENHVREQRAAEVCKKKILEHNLPMNLIDVNYAFDLSKIVFYFTAEGRVDFRELVKDLAYVFRTRIDLRQVGVRDEAKKIGGIGCCGRPLCCANFLGEFAQVSIRMAKEQNLSLNPAKISGICGRLLCCLKFESDYYHEHYTEQVQNNYQPKPGDRVVVEDGVRGKIISVNASRRNATIFIDEEKNVVAAWEDLVPLDAEEPAKKKPARTFEEPPKAETTTPVEREKERPRKNPPRQETPRANNLFDQQPQNDKKSSKRPPRKNFRNPKREPKT